MRLLIILSSFAFYLGLAACQSPYPFDSVVATVETTPVSSKDDAADDPAIWVNKAKPAQSRILATNKQQGLLVYNLQGEQLQSLPVGRVNNVDVRQALTVDGAVVDLAVASNRNDNTIDVFSIDQHGVVKIYDSIQTKIPEIYGICSHKRGVELHVFANGKSGLYQHWLLNPEGQWAPALLGSFSLASQPEGCVVDDDQQVLYVGEEALGVWKMPADASKADQKELVVSVDEIYLKADVEGLALYKTASEKVLVVSSQGNNSYAVFDLHADVTHLTSFKVVDSPAKDIDGSQETDGLAVSSAYLGENFPKGLLVVQDGKNTLPKQNQNFKLVDWRLLETP